MNIFFICPKNDKAPYSIFYKTLNCIYKLEQMIIILYFQQPERLKYEDDFLLYLDITISFD